MVVLLNRKDSATPRVIVLGSTDPELNGHQLGDLDAARFQSEFLCKAALAPLHLVRAED
jgi:hypothetical protein